MYHFQALLKLEKKTDVKYSEYAVYWDTEVNNSKRRVRCIFLDMFHMRWHSEVVDFTSPPPPYVFVLRNPEINNRVNRITIIKMNNSGA